MSCARNQILQMLVRLTGPPRPRVSAAALNSSPILTEQITVSYTHLDVYKRQTYKPPLAKGFRVRRQSQSSPVVLFPLICPPCHRFAIANHNILHLALADNKYILIQDVMHLEVIEMSGTIYSGEPQAGFLLNG